MNKKKTTNQERLIRVRGVISKALEKGPCNFSDLFDRVQEDLKALYPTAGEEQLRLRSYEILQGMVLPGLADKRGKVYSNPRHTRHTYHAHKAILTRTCDTTTHALLEFTSREKGALVALRAFKLGVQDWLQNTDEGKEAWTASGEDFNVGDLNSVNLKALQPFWKEHGVKNVRLRVNEDMHNPGCWTYDTVLG